VTNNDGLNPPVGIDEQIDAAWGVARLRAKAVPAYQPDYAAQQVGYVVVAMAAKAKPTKNFPWAYHGARMADALKVMSAEAKGAPDKAGEYVDKMVEQALKVVSDIEVRQQSAAGNLNSWLGGTPPPHDALYKGVADSTV